MRRILLSLITVSATAYVGMAELTSEIGIQPASLCAILPLFCFN